MKQIKASGAVPQYATSADFFIEDELDGRSGRHLVVKYKDRPAPSEQQFATAIPASWTDDDVKTFIDANIYFRFPLWEIAGRGFGEPTLERVGPFLDAIKQIQHKK